MIAAIDTLLDHHTDAGVADALNRSGTMLRNRAALHRRDDPPHPRKPTSWPAAKTGSAPRACAGIGQTASQLGVCHTTIKKWAAEGRITSEIFNDKGERLYLIPAVAPFKPTAGHQNAAASETLPDKS